MKFWIITLSVTGPLASVRASRRLRRGLPPWLRFSTRWPWVSSPLVSIFDLKGALAFGRFPSAYQVTMIPITSYQDALRVSYVVDTFNRSPALSATFQSGLVAVIETSHET